MTDLFTKSLILKIVSISRTNKRFIMMLADLIALPLALWSGFALRLSEWWPQKYLFASWPLFLIILIAGIFMRLGLYHAIVRFMGAQAFWTVSKGVFLFQIDPFLRSILIGFALVYLVGSRLLMIVLGKIVMS